MPEDTNEKIIIPENTCTCSYCKLRIDDLDDTIKYEGNLYHDACLDEMIKIGRASCRERV